MYFIVLLSFIILLRLITCFAYYFFLSFFLSFFFFLSYIFFYSLVLFLLHILITANDNLLSVLKSRNLIMTVHTNISGVVSQFKTKLVKVLKR